MRAGVPEVKFQQKNSNKKSKQAALCLNFTKGKINSKTGCLSWVWGGRKQKVTSTEKNKSYLNRAAGKDLTESL